MNNKDDETKRHLRFMSHALKAAGKALLKDEVPIGAVVFDPKGKIVATSYNMVHAKKCQTEHAEIRAIKRACKKLGDWRLDGYWVYVTLEPCTMCYGLMRLCRISGLVYGAESNLFSYRIDSGIDLDVYKKDKIEIISGVMRDEAVGFLKHFFKNKRKKGECGKEQCFEICERS